MQLHEVDAETRKWIRNASDELAARNGCRFEAERGQFVVNWIEEYCVLYEGERAGEPMILGDWQLDVTMRLFSWVRWSELYKRWIRRFIDSVVFIAKKNAKSPTLAAWGLYLLSGDGEQGQKVYLGAKDGTQARDIAGKHAMMMVKQNPVFNSVMKTNQNECSITHRPTNSTMKPLSSSSERTQKSKEGLNGSLLVDELHVVDRQFMSIVSRCGISRSEPLKIKVSTAGDDPDSYGKEQFDYALMVEKGEIEDQGFFSAIYAAPQDVKDSEIDEDPIKYGKMANPTWGRIINPEEFMEDYRSSRMKGLREFTLFKMYRLNIWQRSANPWLSVQDWSLCAGWPGKTMDEVEQLLAGRRCVAGLDLSKKRDMSALVLAFEMDEPEKYAILPYFWLPRQTAIDNAKTAAFLTWGEKGLLNLTEGTVTDYGYIRTTFRRLASLFTIEAVYYDATYAEQLTQQISEGEHDDQGNQLVEGLGLDRHEFPQNMLGLAGPTADFERHILNKHLVHPAHPILDWQIGHVRAYTDANNNIRPIKPKQDDLKKIDGVVAAIMALRGIMDKTGVEKSVYNYRRLSVLGGKEAKPEDPSIRSYERNTPNRTENLPPNEADDGSETQVGRDFAEPNNEQEESSKAPDEEAWNPRFQAWANGDDIDD